MSERSKFEEETKYFLSDANDIVDKAIYWELYATWLEKRKNIDLSNKNILNNEIIVQFKNKEIMELFLIQMMDGFGEQHCDFTHWHKSGEGEFIKKYDVHDRLICTVNDISDEF